MGPKKNDPKKGAAVVQGQAPTFTITEDELNQRLQLELSKNMWKRCNPGFNHMAVSRLSKTQEEFLYDEDNVRDDLTRFTFVFVSSHAHATCGRQSVCMATVIHARGGGKYPATREGVGRVCNKVFFDGTDTWFCGNARPSATCVHTHTYTHILVIDTHVG